MSLYSLRCGVQPYAWGSSTLMAERFDWPVTGEPQAELWIGAHPKLTSEVLRNGHWVSLVDAISADPQTWLGSPAVARFGPTLPMLMKVLAIAEPLSLQAHPSPAQAVAGFAREDALGIDRLAPERSYRDDRAKPELICALTTMETLCGFRALDECRSLLAAAGPSIAALGAMLKSEDDLPQVVGSLLTADPVRQRVLVTELLGSLNQLPWVVGSLIRQLATRYPDDVGVVVSLLLNHVTLEPGEAIFLPAGNMHAYLSGLGIEVMANSDNVLRGGLTPKHVDVPELLSTLVPIAGPWAKAPSVSVGGVEQWTTPAAEVELTRADVASLTRPVTFQISTGPTLFVVSDGAVVLTPADGSAMEFGAGETAYGMPELNLSVSGFGTVWRSSVNFDAAP